MKSINSYFADYISEDSNTYKAIAARESKSIGTDTRKQYLRDLNEDTSYFIQANLDMLLEDENGGVMSALWNSVKGMWPSFTTWVKGHPIAMDLVPGSDPKNVTDSAGNEVIGGLNLPGKVKALGEWMQKNPNATAAGLAGAGLLGTYYLFKKFMSKKKLDKDDLAMSSKIDQTDPKKLDNR